MTLPQRVQQRRFDHRRRGHHGLKPRSETDLSVERELVRRYHADGDLAARDRLVDQLMPLAQKLAKRYVRSGAALEDLVGVATVSLINAVDRFDPRRGTSISSYAVQAILGELKRDFGHVSRSSQLARDTQERVMYVSQAVESLSNRLGRSPTPAEIAQQVGESTERVLEALEAASTYDSAPLEANCEGKENRAEPLAK